MKMNPLIENILSNVWILLLIFKNYIFGNSDIELAICWIVITGSLVYAVYLYRKRWDELKFNRPDLFMMIEERKKAMQESKRK